MILAKDNKRILFKKWFLEHIENTNVNIVPLFISKVPDFELTIAAENLFKSQIQGNYIYIMFFNKENFGFIPLYVGKTANLLTRWKDGHIKNLKKAANNALNGTYINWVNRLEMLEEEICLFCLQEKNVIFSPIPNFPITIGAIEYQLISLAADGYPGFLLNNEGVGR